MAGIYIVLVPRPTPGSPAGRVEGPPVDPAPGAARCRVGWMARRVSDPRPPGGNRMDRIAPLSRLVRLAPAAAALAALLLPAPSRACSVCACGDPLVAVGQVAGPAGQFGLELDGQWLSMTAGGEEPGTL